MGGPEFETKLDELLEDYRHVVWQSYQLPFFSIMPTLIFLGQYFIAILGIFVELILLPYTLIALFLRLFKVRWRIIAPFSKRAWFLLVYISRGEFYGSIVMRPVVRWLAKSHIARRLRMLGELVATSEHFTAEARNRLGAKIAEAQARFPVRELTDFFKDSLIPALVFGSISFITDLVGGADEKRLVKLAAYAILGLIAIYGVSIVIAGFPTKRGLLLGREVKRAAFPGGIKGQGLYGLEREIFSIFPVRPKEMSLDVMFFIFAAGVSPVIAIVASAPGIMAQFASNLGLAGSEAVDVAAQLGNYAFVVAVYVFIRIRRGVLKRN
ncbi:MAG TPA: hypothetical protein VG735_04200 [Caulobacterales bacterium]|nr:hypothetical protein [Caulobacterales bacterium]